jgi:hypothetical protein
MTRYWGKIRYSHVYDYPSIVKQTENLMWMRGTKTVLRFEKRFVVNEDFFIIFGLSTSNYAIEKLKELRFLWVKNNKFYLWQCKIFCYIPPLLMIFFFLKWNITLAKFCSLVEESCMYNKKMRTIESTASSSKIYSKI